MNNIKEIIHAKKQQLNKKVSFALLSGAVTLKSSDLIKSWANLSANDNSPIYENGNTALHIAVQNSWPDATEILLNKGASLKSINYEDLSVTTLARNIHEQYENEFSSSFSYERETAIDEEKSDKLSKAKQVLDIIDKYQYADNI